RHARVRLVLLPRLWAADQLGELAERAREPAGVPELDSRLAAYRALAHGTEARASDDPIAPVLATTAAAQPALRGRDRRRAHALFAAARAAATDVAGYGAPEVGQLAARELVS